MSERMVEALRDGEIVRVSEREARMEGLMILRILEPKSFHVQQQELSKQYPVSSTLGKPLAGALRTKSHLERWRSSFVDYKNNNVIKDLKPTFHWEVSKARRAKNLSRRQLALALGVDEEAIRIVELGGLPSDDFVLVNKLEQYLGISIKLNRAADPSASAGSKKQEPTRHEIMEEKEKNMQAEDFLGKDIDIVED